MLPSCIPLSLHPKIQFHFRSPSPNKWSHHVGRRKKLLQLGQVPPSIQFYLFTSNHLPSPPSHGVREISIGAMTLTWTFIGMAVRRSPSSRDQPKPLHLRRKSVSPASSTSSGRTSRSTSPSTKAKPVHRLPISDSAAPMDLDIAPRNSQHA